MGSGKIIVVSLPFFAPRKERWLYACPRYNREVSSCQEVEWGEFCNLFYRAV